MRQLDTEDPEDFVLPMDTAFTIGWAVLTDSATLTTKHNQAGSFTAMICSDTTETCSYVPLRAIDSVAGLALTSLATLALVLSY